MRITIVSPVPADSTRGNGVTAHRWELLLRDLGHDVRVQCDSRVARETDSLIALHARRSAAAVESFAAEQPQKPIVLAMTGTDLYGDLPDDPDALRSVAIADRIVVLQPFGIARLPVDARGKAIVIRQSVPTPEVSRTPDRESFGVCVLAHLRAVKDPLLAAEAASLLPEESRIHVTLAGAAEDAEWHERAAAEDRRNPRFTWAGELDRESAAELLGRSHLLVVSSRMEGGANVVSEAIALGVPVLATHIDGNVGMLGDDYPGYFPVGDAGALTARLSRAETDTSFLTELENAVVAQQPLFHPVRERNAWESLLQRIV